MLWEIFMSTFSACDTRGGAPQSGQLQVRRFERAVELMGRQQILVAPTCVLSESNCVDLAAAEHRTNVHSLLLTLESDV